MIKAICDKCGKEITLRYFDFGFENPRGWNLEKVYQPLEREWVYRTFCPDCNPRIVREVGE